MSGEIRLIAGLGNPGPEYEQTRHNAGFWFLDTLVQRYGGQFRPESKFHGLATRLQIRGHELWLIKPTTFMNRSGQAVAALANFYKIPPEQILIVHDELDLGVGIARLKRGGGHGGHNGLRDLHTRLGGNGYARLRIGIGHPGDARAVTGYVLGKPPLDDRVAIDRAIDEALEEVEPLLEGEWERAVHRLHSRR